MADLLKRLTLALGLLVAFSLGSLVSSTPSPAGRRWIDPAMSVFVPPVEAVFRASLVKQIQHVSIALTNAQNTNTATITAVVAANTFQVYRGCTNADTVTSGDNLAYFTYTNTTTITLTRFNIGGRAAMTCEEDVVEYYTGTIASIQRNTPTGNGRLAAAATTSAWTIAAVNTAKIFVSMLGRNYNANPIVNQDVETRAVITNATTITLTRVGSAATTDTSLEVIEFK